MKVLPAMLSVLLGIHEEGSERLVDRFSHFGDRIGDLGKGSASESREGARRDPHTNRQDHEEEEEQKLSL